MRLIRRKTKTEESSLHCAVCRERLVGETTTCPMCGEPLSPLLREQLRERAQEDGGNRR